MVFEIIRNNQTTFEYGLFLHSENENILEIITQKSPEIQVIAIAGQSTSGASAEELRKGRILMKFILGPSFGDRIKLSKENPLSSLDINQPSYIFDQMFFTIDVDPGNVSLEGINLVCRETNGFE